MAEITSTDVVCIARNDAALGGLLTVFHTERSASSLTNLQNELPVLLMIVLANVRQLPISVPDSAWQGSY